MIRIRTGLFASVALSGVALLAAPPASAQPATPAGATTEPSAEGARLTEVIVTATKREQSLQKVPVAVTALTADQLVKTESLSLRDLQFQVPNLAFGGQSSARRPDIALRGITSGARVPGFEGSVGFFVDGVYQPFPAQWVNPVADVERVEVLYGPQDALFGKNTVAGAISTITKQPTNNFGGYVTADFGNYDYRMARGAVNLPIIPDKLSARVTLYGAWRDGYTTNVFNGHDYNNLDQQGARLAFRYDPNDQLRITLSLGGYTERQAEVQGQTSGGLYSQSDPRKVNLNSDPKTSRDLYDAKLTGQYRLGGGGTITSISAIQTVRAKYTTDEDGNPVNFWYTNIVDHARAFSQELRYTSPLGPKVDYIAGLYFLDTHWSQLGSLETLPADPDNDPGGLGVLNADGTKNYSDGKGKRVDARSYAVFGNARYHFTDQWTLELGGRFSYDDKDLTFPGQPVFGAGFLNLCKLGRSLGAGCLVPGGFYPAVAAYQDNYSRGEPSGAIALDYQATPDILVYGKISRGEKGGGWNSDISRVNAPPAKFSAEHVWNYELGAKTEFFNHHLRLNGDLFYQDYSDKQETVFISITDGFKISNAASATIKGLELTATLVAGDFTLNGGIGYVDPTYDDFQCTATVNCKGQQLVFASPVTASASVEWAHQFANIGRASLFFQGNYRDGMYLAVPNDPASSVPDYAIFNGRATLQLRDGKTELYLFAKNLTDKTYLLSRFPGDPAFPGFGATANLLYGEPRTFGVGITRQF